MKSFVAFALFAASVRAEDGYTCVNDGWAPTELTGENVTDSATCKTACEATIDTDQNAWCCAAVVDSGDAPSVTCFAYVASPAGGDIRAEATDDTATLVSSAWAWDEGAQLDNIGAEDEAETEVETEAETEDEEENEDLSVRVTTSFLAAATVAMLAM